MLALPVCLTLINTLCLGFGSVHSIQVPPAGDVYSALGRPFLILS